MVQRSYKPTKVDGRKVVFVVRDGRIWARVPSLSKKQFLGMGSTKTETIADVRKAMKHIKVTAKGKRRRR